MQRVGMRGNHGVVWPVRSGERSPEVLGWRAYSVNPLQAVYLGKGPAAR